MTEPRRPRAIPAPKLPAHDTPDAWPEGELEDHESYSGLNLIDELFRGARGVSFQQMRIKRADINALQLARLDLTDVLFEGCDLSNADWSQASGRRVRLEECRLTGLKMANVTLVESTFHNCQGKYMQFNEAVFKQVRFEHCSLIEANFDGADLSGVVFADCDLLGATFTKAKLQGTDFRSAKLESSRIALDGLRGAIISPFQAAALLERHAGVRILSAD